MDALIRPFERDDTPGVVALERGLEPDWISTVPGFLHALDTEPARARRRIWVAEQEGHIVGRCTARFRWAIERDDVAWILVGVREDYRRQGIGSTLYELGERYLVESGARKIDAWSEEEAGHRFLEARDFQRTREERLWSLDPRTVDLTDLPRLEAKRSREGFRLATLRELEHRVGDVYPLWAETVADIPGDDPETNISRAEWESRELANPDVSWEGSVVVMHEGRPVALAWLFVDHETAKAEHEMTGTLRDYRRRGLARLAKMATIRWAVENGITVMLTGNDSTNADMLALNEHLGYRPLPPATQWSKAV
jgi:GNAT superfamily N-acetyltransferase